VIRLMVTPRQMLLGGTGQMLTRSEEWWVAPAHKQEEMDAIF